MYVGMGTAIYVKIKGELGFWNFSRNRLAGHTWPLGDTSTRPSFWVSVMNRLVAEDESPGGTNPISLLWSFFMFLRYLWCGREVCMLEYEFWC